MHYVASDIHVARTKRKAWVTAVKTKLAEIDVINVGEAVSNILDINTRLKRNDKLVLGELTLKAIHARGLQHLLKRREEMTEKYLRQKWGIQPTNSEGLS